MTSFEFEFMHKIAINFYSGSVELITKAKLDVKQSPYLLVVTAYDGPVHLGTTLFSKKTVRVHVLNKGSMSVWVDKSTGEAVDYYSARVDEEQSPNTAVLNVQAVWPSLTGEETDPVNIVYEIEANLVFDSNSTTPRQIKNPYYKIDNVTGLVVTTEMRLDYEEADPFKKQLMRDIKIKAASLDGFHKYSTHVSIEVIDLNDNAPMFDAFIEAKANTSLFCLVENTTNSNGVNL